MSMEKTLQVGYEAEVKLRVLPVVHGVPIAQCDGCGTPWIGLCLVVVLVVWALLLS